MQGTGQAAAGCAVAVPAVVPELLRWTGAKVALAEQGLLANDVPGGAVCGGGRCPGVALEGLVQPLLLRWPQQGARSVIPLRAGFRIERARAQLAVRRTSLGIAVLAVVQQVQVGQTAIGNVPIQTHLCTGAKAYQRAGQYAGAQRHVLVIGLVGRGAVGSKVWHWPAAAASGQPGVVVLDLVVVPGHQPGAGSVRSLQIWVALVQGVAGAVVVQRQQPAATRGRVRGADGHAAFGRRTGVFVQVIAQEQHQVQVFLRHVLVGAEVAIFPFLARGIGQPQPRRPGTWRGKGAGAPHRADFAVHLEAVKVPAVSVQALHFNVYRVRQFGQGLGLAALHDAREPGVVGQLPTDGQWRQPWRGDAEPTGGVQPRPQHHTVMGGRATGHAQGEGAVTPRGLAAGTARQPQWRCGRHGQ